MASTTTTTAATASLLPIAPALSPSQCNPKAKRKREPEPAASGSIARKPRDGSKKKKAARACNQCQKAHLTCNDSRPCDRCIKRGIAANCTEGHRKKAKYLLDDDELEQLKRNKTQAPTPASACTAALKPITRPPTPPPDNLVPESPAFDVPFDTNFPFGSEAANLEYSILSAILGNPSPPQGSQTPPSSSFSTWPSTDSFPYQSPRLSTSYTDSLQQPPAPMPQLNYTYPTRVVENAAPAQPETQTNKQAKADGPPHPLQPRYPLENRPRSPPLPIFLDEAHGLLSPPQSNPSPSLSSANTSDINFFGFNDLKGRPASKLQSINDRVVKPYDYTEGYHFLMKHLPTRFEKNDILRIVRALAIFRPSLIALQMPLSLDDEIFVEKCFQRTLLELDKLISFSGTPTVVWRRTGEICLVAPEFCMLTEWTMEELLGQKKYIYELFENQSVVEYWENFASHAFENTTQSVYSHCVLLKPNGAPVPATFCFSIRRDLFDLPSVVIGQWLPLL
ncbi:Transcriptional regulator of nonfermentable carbon utilization [Marasmius oreades]|uniref:Transcription activator of gluconeogenesis ERT1 n=1 Tax=Marasmius oreades TaxID=181124 RepID=A0A9P8AEM1_9AGAR|nr:Transcriptional regulator of nonfermentable carbon utilization [Marasmius oreades]KAG7098759.1 Transcriptional regulator of nonfermentable carbon utilization [Marasmius oreades]